MGALEFGANSCVLRECSNGLDVGEGGGREREDGS